MRGTAGRGAVLAAVSLLLAAGCSGSSGPRTMTSEASLDAIAGRMTDMVSDNGIPIEGDYIRCIAALDGHSAVCHGLTSSEPAKDIKGIFAESPAAPAQPGCPGTLTVSVGPAISDIDVPGPVSPLQARRMDPCR